jgi:hypothetical protein
MTRAWSAKARVMRRKREGLASAKFRTAIS